MKIWRLLWFTFSMAAVWWLGLMTAFAHVPTFNSEGSPTPEEAFIIEDIDLSLALFGDLQEAGSVDFYRLDVPEGHVMEFQLFVPVACDTFRPQMALAGADVIGSATALELELPAEMGVDAVSRDHWGMFFEPFDPSFYFAGPSIRHVARGGTYFVAVYSTQDQPGAYLLSMSGREEFSAGEGWRGEKSAYDSCEIGANNWFWRQWRSFLTGGVLLFGSLIVVALIRWRRA